MSDLGEITALVNSYARLLDGGDMDGVTALFAHSTWRSEPHGRVLRGIEEIRPVYEQLKTYDGSPRTKHLLTNLTVDVETGASTASAHCYWTVLQNVAPGSAISVILSGQYTDTFEKVDGAWCFADRLITVDLTGDASAHVD
jgi:3-phenylpropionate/cinnamic acid dioxygenase small subunit